MPKIKMKTKKAAAKRFKITATGVVMHKQTGMSHLLSKKSRRRKRRLSIPSAVVGRKAAKMDRLLPYGSR